MEIMSESDGDYDNLTNIPWNYTKNGETIYTSKNFRIGSFGQLQDLEISGNIKYSMVTDRYYNIGAGDFEKGAGEARGQADLGG